jgi:hypothetical protein
MLKLRGLATTALVVLMGCHSSDVTGLEGLSFSATASVVSDSTFINGTRNHVLRTDFVLQNISGAPIQVEYGPGCPVSSILASASRTGAPFFDSGSDRACTTELALRTIAAGESVTLQDRAYVPETSLAAGTYYVTARTGLNRSTISIAAGMVTLQ